MAVTEGELTDEAPVGATIASVTRRRTPVRIPAERYTSQAWADLEMAKVWPKVWQLACSVDHVANAGDFFEYTVGKYSVIIVRGDDGELRARTERMRAIGHEPDPDVWIMGLPDQAGARLRELADAGCDRVMLQMLLHDDVDQIALAAQLAEAVS